MNHAYGPSSFYQNHAHFGVHNSQIVERFADCCVPVICLAMNSTISTPPMMWIKNISAMQLWEGMTA
jgi:hypothetical protein